MAAKRLLLHVCCAPCMMFPIENLKNNSAIEFSCYFYNNNIHPYSEFIERLEAVKEYSSTLSLKTIYDEGYYLDRCYDQGWIIILAFA